MQLAAVLVVCGVALFAGTLMVLHSRPDDLMAQLLRTPGYELTIPHADEVWDNAVPSVAGAGANRTRIWGVRGSVDDARRELDAALGGLGYQKTGATGPGLLGEYRRDDTRFRATWVGLPHRLPGGRFVGSGYDFFLYTTIENGERADAP